MPTISSCTAWPRHIVVALVIIAGSLGAERAFAQRAAGADVKAAFLFNFVKFVEWPAGALADGQPFVIGVFGDDAIADSLVAIVNGKSIEGRGVTVRRLTGSEDLATVQILFVGAAQSNRIAALIKRLGSSSVLTVSDAYRFCTTGGVIQFRSEADRVRFDVNLRAAEAAGLVINSKLLALAGTVNPRAN